MAELTVLQAEPDGQRFTDWLEAAPIGRTAARELLTGLGIEPAKVRLPGISAAVAWLNPEQLDAMDAAAARVANGESVAQVLASADGEPTADGPAPVVRAGSRPDTDTIRALAGALLQAQAGTVLSPLARARALREAAAEGLRLTTGELSELTGRPVAAIERLRSGSRFQGYRLWRCARGPADPEQLWTLTDTDGPRTMGDPLRAPDRD